MKLAFIISFIVQLLLVNAASVTRSNADNSESSDYLITVPKVLTNEQDKICLVWLNEQTRPSEQFDVKIKEIGSETVLQQVSAPLSSETVCVEIPTKKIRIPRVELEVTVGQKVSEKHEVQVRPVVNLVLIETSKPVYKPAETIEFNLLTVNQQLKPATEVFKKVWIENPYATSIKQWKNVETKDGILSFRLETSEENVLGKWTIKALTKDDQLIVKVFELTRYLTPKINIDIVKPNYLLASEKQTEIEIKVQDQFDYPINGKAKITVGYKPAQYEQSREIIAENMPTEKFEKEIKEGSAKITIDHEKLQANSKLNAQRLLILSIEVEQEKTGLTQTLIQELPISQRQILVTLPSARMGKQYFKPNMPFKSYFTVEKPDLTEAQGQKVNVCVEQRQKAWVPEKEGKQCKEFTSDKNGIVRYETQPINEKTEQLFITVHPVEQPEDKKSFVIQPWFDNSEVNFIITPAIKREQCSKKHNVEIIFRNLDKKITAFYQVVGSKTEKPVKFTVDPAKAQKISDKLSKFNIEIESGLLSSISQPIARIAVFLRDTNKTLVADYDTFEVNCQDQQPEIKVNANQNNKNKYEFDVNVNAQPDAKCILQVSQHDARHELIQKRVARLMEKMDLNLDLINRDKCEKELYVRHARNTGLSYVVPQENIINYKSSWDVFNKIGLEAISNMDLDKSPCEAQLYPNGFSTEMVEEFEKVKYNLLVQRNYYINDLTELTRLEQNTTDDLVQWINMDRSNKNQKVIVRNNQVGPQGQLHFNAICLSPKTGIQFAHKKVVPQVVQPFEVDIIAPEQMIVNEVVQVHILLHKENPQAVPVVVEPVPNTHFEIVLESGEHNKFNFDGEHHRVIYRVKALHPVHQTVLQFTVHDGQNGQHYPTKVHSHHISVVEHGSIVRNTEYQILFNEQNGKKQIELVNTKPTGQEKQLIKNLTVSTDILDILIPNQQQQQKEQSNHEQKQIHSARDGLSLQYKSPVELVSYLTILAETEKTAQTQQQKKTLRNEIERVYQQLETKRLPDGSYSTFIGKQAALPFSDLSLTSTIFKLYVQLKQNEQLPQITDYSLKQTFVFLNKLQSEQGSFATPIQETTAFPMSLRKPLDVTAYVAMQLAEAKSDFDSPIMKKALRYIVQQLKTTASDKEEQDFANAVVAYLYALKGNVEKSEKWSSKVDSKDLNQLAKREHGEQIIAIQAMTAVKLSKKSEIERLAKWLFTKQQENNQDQLFSSPIMSQAIVRVWTALNGQNQSIKVNGQQVSRNQVRFGDNVNKVNVEGKGFVIATYKKEQTRLNENQKEFKITVNGLKRGFRSCAQRSINVCYKSRDGQKVSRNPVMNVQIPTGYQVDEYLLSSMLSYGSASQLDSFDIRQQNLHLLMKPAHGKQSHCIEIPVVQIQKVEQRQKNFIQMINYYDYQQQLSRKDIAQYDTIFYELPKECEIIDRPLFTLGQTARPQPQIQPRNDIFESHHAPLEIQNCPEDVEDSCPTCLDELNKSHEDQVCKTNFLSSVHRRDLKTHERELFNQTKSQKRCIVLPLKLEQIVLNKEQKLQQDDDILVYVNEKCRCSYINERQGHGKAILIKNDIEKAQQTKQAVQLTKEDTLVVYSQAQSNELPSCIASLKDQQLRRSKRDVDGDKKDEALEGKDDKNSKRSGYGTAASSYAASSYTPAPMPAYAAAPAPSYAQPAADYSYAAPSPPPAYEAAPAYPAPAAYAAPPPPAAYSPPAPAAYSPPAAAYPAPAAAYSPPPPPPPAYSPAPAAYSPPPPPAAAYPAPAAAYSPPPPAYEAAYPAPAAYSPPPPPAAYSPPSYAAPAPSYDVQYQMYEEPKQQYYQPPPPPAYSPPAPAAYPPSYDAAPVYPAAPAAYAAPPPPAAYSPPAPAAYAAPPPPAAYSPPAPAAYPPPPPPPAYAPPPVYEAPAPIYSAPTTYTPPAPPPPPSYSAPAYAPPAAPAYEAPAAYPAPAAPAPPAYAPPASYAPPPPSPSYSSYKRSAGYGSAPAIAEYKPTQPEYNQPQYSAYSANPGYMNAGYAQASSAYAPAPIIIAPIYEPPAPAPVAYKPAAAYKRSVAFDLASSASNAYQAYAVPPMSYGAADSYSATYSLSVPAPAYSSVPAYPAPAAAYPAPPPPSYAAPAAYEAAAPQVYGDYAAPAPAPAYPAPAPAYPAPAPAYPAPAPAYPVPAAAPYAAPAPAPVQYAVLYTPVKYATAYVPSYVAATPSSYGSGSGYAAVPASSYGGYASASEQKSSFVRSPVECEQPAKTCPVCDDMVNLELVNNICKLDLISTAYKLNQTASSNKNKAVCGQMNVIENLTNAKSQDEQKEFGYTIKESCECPQLRKLNNIHANAIVLAPKRNVNGQTVRLDENTFVLNDSIDVRHEIYNIARLCGNKNDLDDF